MVHSMYIFIRVPTLMAFPSSVLSVSVPRGRLINERAVTYTCAFE